MVSRNGPVLIGLSAVFSSVRAVFLVILGSEAAEGALFSSHIVLGTGVRLDRRRAMLEDRPHSVVPAAQQKMGRQDYQEILTLIGRISTLAACAWDSLSFLARTS
jgi:hypothetical protein